MRTTYYSTYCSVKQEKSESERKCSFLVDPFPSRLDLPSIILLRHNNNITKKIQHTIYHNIPLSTTVHTYSTFRSIFHDALPFYLLSIDSDLSVSPKARPERQSTTPPISSSPHRRRLEVRVSGPSASSRAPQLPLVSVE